MIVTLLSLNVVDLAFLRITDAYSLHRVVYDLFEDERTEGQKHISKSCGFLFVDKGGSQTIRNILILSNRPPQKLRYGEINSKHISNEFLTHDKYSFEVVLNPTKRDCISGKTIAIRGRKTISQWFVDKAPKSWGFRVEPESLQVQNMDVKTFVKKGHKVTLNSANLMGTIIITDRTKFVESFQKGIGRGRAFGFGLLQIIPLLKSN